MSSWLGGLGSGLGQVGGSLSSFTGQLSNFTKDMLLEGVEEVGDAATELQLSNSKLADTETALSSSKFECDRMKKLQAELEEKLEASEIQNKQQSDEYRALLQQKDVEISHLKARQSGLQEDVQNLQRSAQRASAGPAPPAIGAGSVGGASHHGFGSDDMDLGEVIWSQQEINRLSNEVLRMEAELTHWRRVSQASTAVGGANTEKAEILKLQRTVEELRDELIRQVDEHQHQLATLQDVQRQKMSDLIRCHQEELKEYEERIEELEEHVQNAPSSRPPEEIQTAAETPPPEESAQLAALRSERDDAREENQALLQSYGRLQSSVEELQERVREQEGKAVHRAQLEWEIQVLRHDLDTAQKETDRLKGLLEQAKAEEEVEHAEILELNTIISKLREENQALEIEKKLSTAVQGAAGEVDGESAEDLRVALESREKTLKATQEERDTLLNELEELDRQNQEATQHLISTKDQLKSAEAELVATKEQKKELERHLEAQKEQLSQSAYALNDLHVSKQQLEANLRELKDQLAHREFLEKEKKKEEEEEPRERELRRTEDGELSDLRLELEKATSEVFQLKMDNGKLKEAAGRAEELSEESREKDALAQMLKRNAAELEASLVHVREETVALGRALEEKERQLAAMKEDNSHLKEELERLRDQQSRPAAIAELEAEIARLKSSAAGLEERARDLDRSLEERQAALVHAREELERASLHSDGLLRAKDRELAELRRASETRGPTERDRLILDKTDALKRENGNEKHDLSKAELERLAKDMKEKETQISLLNEENLSLTRELDQLALSREQVGKLSQVILQKDLEIQALHARVTMGGGQNQNQSQSQDVLFLQQQLQAFGVEREQVLAVLNEKTRDNSQLRSDYHRLVDVVASKEAALLKLQQENQRLSRSGDASGNQEMFKETIQNLSRIIREKDIEIDALTQKCQTLVTVLQSSGGDAGGVSSNQFEELLKERDALKQRVKKMEEWKQQVITTVKNMQQESGQLQEELVQLRAQVLVDADAGSKMSADYDELIQSYQRKERRLGDVSDELATVRRGLVQLNAAKDLLLGRLQIEVPRGQDETDLETDPTSLPAQRDDPILEGNQAQEVHRIRASLETLQSSVRDKDLLIKSKGDQLSRVSEALRNRESDNEVLKQAVTNLKERALILEMDAQTLKAENERVAASSREKDSEFRALQETNMQVSMLLREREFELGALRDKADTVEKMLKDKEQGNSGELNQLLNEIKSMQDKAVAFQQERDQVVMALKQKQMESTALHTELQHVRDKEQRLNLELERLRNHLLEMEDSYTREALAAEDRETELRRRVAHLDERLATSSGAVESASQQASMQVESLQEQLGGVVKQRDDALLQLRTSQEQVKQYAVSLSNLQMVLEQFQQEEKAMYSAELDKLRKEKEAWQKKADKLEDQASALQINLDEATAALDSASRLADQLDLKEEQMEELQRQVDVRQEMLDEAQKKLMNLLNSTEGKIDKALMRNLLQGYFHTPRNKRPDVLRLMGNVLALGQDDMEKMLEEDVAGGVSGWVSSWLGARGAPRRPPAERHLNTSFSEMFVKFLETESTPSLPPLKLPVLDMAPLGPSRRTASNANNPFLAPRSAAVPLSGTGAVPPGGHLLMKPISNALPTFTPVPVAAEARGGAVLEDLLKQ
ncbi:thyroid receptor-interacting protein 11 [Stigmatopora argus]